eukprot:1149514-Pelagomonas_calceolata.AAC.1
MLLTDLSYMPSLKSQSHLDPTSLFIPQVDAALDATNVARVAHYIRDKTRGLGNNDNNEAEQRGVETDRGPSSFQSIVISLK